MHRSASYIITVNITLPPVFFTHFVKSITWLLRRWNVDHKKVDSNLLSFQFLVVWRKIKTWNVDRSCGSPSVHLQWVTLKAARRDRVVNDWVETRTSDWMVAIINKALGKRSYGEPSTRAPTLKPVGFIKKWV